MELQLDLTSKVTSTFVLFAVMLLAAVGAPSYNSGREALQAATVSELASEAVEKRAALNAWVQERQSDIALLANSPSLLKDMAALAAAQPDSDAARAPYDSLVAELQTQTGPGQTFQALLVIEPGAGEVIAATDGSEKGEFKGDRPYFINGRDGPYIENPYHSLALQGPAMTVSAPLRSADGRLLGVLAGRLNLDAMNAIVTRRTSLWRTADAYLVNTSNLFVTQPRFISDPAVLQRGIHTEIVERCLAGNSGVLSADDYRGLAVIAVYYWLPERQLCLVAKVDQSEALEPSHSLGHRMIFIGGFALLAALGLAMVLARTITRPILALKDGAARFGQGRLDVRLPETSGDELGLLAREFNTMAAALSEKETQLRQRAELLEQANKELEAFSYSVSHDLRAPLRAIDGFSRILLEEYAPQLVPEAQRYLRLVRGNAKQMGYLIDDLLTFSRLSRQPLQKQLVAPADLVRECLEDLRAEREGRRVEITIGDASAALRQGSKQALPACEADPSLLKQVWINLLSNALKFTRHREVAVIEIGCREEDDEDVYFVKDNGVGFDMQYVGKLFGVFQRLHRAEEYEGTGVGLAIVQRIVHRHGGRVWAEAEVDKGATFYFTLGGGISNG